MRYIKRKSLEFDDSIRAEYEKLNIERNIAKILYQRNIMPEDSISFLEPKLEDLYNPFLFNNMEKIIKRIEKAKANLEKVAVYGDYDCDGISSCYIMKNTLKCLGIDARVYIPNRYSEGYGTNEEAFRKLIDDGISLIITVDCGIRSNDDVIYAKGRNTDVIIMDHHEPGDEIPESEYILNPKVPNECYPFKDLCGAGICFKFSQAVLGEKAMEYIDIAGMATIADMVSLLDENRVIAKYGLKKINDNPCFGLKALIKVSALTPGKITSRNVGFALAPRINASGRLSDAMLSLSLLLTEDETESNRLAIELNTLNTKRQDLQKQIIAQAEEDVNNNINLSETRIIFVKHEGWDKGVVGLVAASLVRTFNRPAVVLSEENGKLTGSARSIYGVDLYSILNSASALFDHFGGHTMAAGLTFDASNYEEIVEKVNEEAMTLYSDEYFVRKEFYDLEISPVDITEKFANDMQKMEPYGQDNDEPVIYIRNIKIDDYKLLSNGLHLKFSNNGVDYLFFNYRDRIDRDSAYELSGTVGINEFFNRRTVQILLRSLSVKQYTLSNIAQMVRDPFIRNFTEEIISYTNKVRNRINDYDELYEFLMTKGEESLFGTLVVVSSAAGLKIASSLIDEGVDYNIAYGNPGKDAENTILLTTEEVDTKNYTTVLYLGSYSRYKNTADAYIYTGEDFRELFRKEVNGYFVEPDEIDRYAKAFVDAGSKGFEKLSELLNETNRKMESSSIKKALFAFKVCVTSGLISLYKNDKIFVKLNYKRTDLSSNPLYKKVEEINY